MKVLRAPARYTVADVSPLPLLPVLLPISVRARRLSVWDGSSWQVAAGVDRLRTRSVAALQGAGFGKSAYTPAYTANVCVRFVSNRLPGESIGDWWQGLYRRIRRAARQSWIGDLGALPVTALVTAARARAIDERQTGVHPARRVAAPVAEQLPDSITREASDLSACGLTSWDCAYRLCLYACRGRR